jgi:hypothetical protein
MAISGPRREASATLREFAAVFLSYKAVNLAVCFLLVAVPVMVTLLHHPPAGPTAIMLAP